MDTQSFFYGELPKHNAKHFIIYSRNIVETVLFANCSRQTKIIRLFHFKMSCYRGHLSNASDVIETSKLS